MAKSLVSGQHIPPSSRPGAIIPAIISSPRPRHGTRPLLITHRGSHGVGLVCGCPVTNTLVVGLREGSVMVMGGVTMCGRGGAGRRASEGGSFSHLPDETPLRLMVLEGAPRCDW